MSITNLRPMVYARAAHPRLSSRCTYTSSSTSRTPRAGSSTSCIYTLRPARRAKMSTTASESTQVNTFVNQNKLPRLPIPDLEKSTQGYVKSLIPVLEQNVSPADLPKEIEKRKLFARDFVASGSIGRELQERLKDLDHISPNNWLNDTLWLTLAYHTWRAPLLVNSNYWLLFAPDPSDPTPPTYSAPTSFSSTSIPNPNHNPSAEAPKDSLGGGEVWLKENTKNEKGLTWDEAVVQDGVTGWQIRKAAWMVRRYAEFREMVAKEELPPDTSKAGPFCMVQYKRLFNFSRIPLPGTDAFSAIANQALHSTVMIDDFVYSIDVFAKPESSEGIPTPLPVDEIERNIQAVVNDAKQRKTNGEEAVRAGILTADERDNWTKNRERLISLSRSNRESLNSISTSLLCLSLDSYTLPSIPTNDPLVHPSVDAQVRNGVAGIYGGRNRWYDKNTGLVVESNGRALLSGEHSAVDALIPNVAMDYVSKKPVDEAAFRESAAATEDGWARLDWVVDNAMRRAIAECEARNRELIEDSDASQLWWAEFGVEWIKKNAKVSPDAFIQQALQLAWYREQGYATATYETASTRMMLHGRTDVIRTLSVESRAFVKSMMDPNTDDATRYERLTEASTAHIGLSRRSTAGLGWDRHLMGLKVMLRPGETHPLFEDEMYAKSQEWKMSTSGLTSGQAMTGSGFGAAWPDGYGINYLAGPYLIKFGIESKWSCEKTSTARFKHHLAQSLRDMRRVVEAAA